MINLTFKTLEGDLKIFSFPSLYSVLSQLKTDNANGVFLYADQIVKVGDDNQYLLHTLKYLVGIISCLTLKDSIKHRVDYLENCY